MDLEIRLHEVCVFRLGYCHVCPHRYFCKSYVSKINEDKQKLRDLQEKEKEAFPCLPNEDI